MNKRIFKILSPLGSHVILVFSYKMLRQYTDGNLPNGGVECRWGSKTRHSRLVYGFFTCCQRCNSQVLSTRCHRTMVSYTLVAGKWRSLLMVGDDNEMFMKEASTLLHRQNLILRSGKFEAEVTNNRRLRLMYCTIEANY